MSLLRPVVLVAGGMAETRGLNEGWPNGVNDGGDTMEASALQGTRSYTSGSSSRLIGAVMAGLVPAISIQQAQ